MDIISRENARAIEFKFFFTGKPCKHNHMVKRYVSSGNCTKCVAEKAKEWRKNNPEKVKNHHRKWRKNNPDVIKSLSEEYYKKNHEKIRIYSKKWNKKNPEKVAVIWARRRALKRNALDTTVPKEIFFEIEKLRNDIVAATGIDHHTDHFIPLAKGGIHTPSNLRIIPAVVNQKKHTQIWSEKKLEATCRSYYVEQGLGENDIKELISMYSLKTLM